MRPIYFTMLLLASCAGLNKTNLPSGPGGDVHPSDVQLFEKAFHDLGQKNYKVAIPVFQKLAQKYQGQDLESAALYNLGSAYKELGQCKKARDIYQNLLAKVKDRVQLKPRLALSLSYVYECLGDSQKTLISLKEGLPFVGHLAEETKLVEYPGRLSLAYFRLGEQKAGLKLQKQIYQNLDGLKKQFRISSVADESFARYFYTIGCSHLSPHHVNLASFLKVFLYHQAYLVQSILLKAGPWSIRAEQELGNLYRKLWRGLKSPHSRKTYRPEVQKILQQLKIMTQSTTDPKIKGIYRGLNKKTLDYLVRPEKGFINNQIPASLGNDNP